MGCTNSKPNTKENSLKTEIKKSFPVKTYKPLTKTNPFLKLNKNLILECIEFNSPFERLSIKLINRKFKSLINTYLKIHFEENKNNNKYLNLVIPQNILFPLEMKIIAKTKTEGSASWVELEFLKDNLMKNRVHRLIIDEYYIEKDYKIVQKVYDFKNKNLEEKKKLLESFVPGGIIRMVFMNLFRMKCFMREASIELKYMVLDK